MRRRPAAPLLALLGALMAAPAFLWPTAAPAADAEGRFALKGGGAAPCSAFLRARQEAGMERQLFEGFVDGYVTAANQLTPDTFDLVPWQSTALLLDFLAQHCERNPTMAFGVAVSRMAAALVPERLRATSRVVGTEAGGSVAPIYEEVLRRAQEALRRRGQAVPAASDGAFDAATREAVRRFQRASRVEVTGLLDQRTLFLLLQPAPPAPR